LRLSLCSPAVAVREGIRTPSGHSGRSHLSLDAGLSPQRVRDDRKLGSTSHDRTHPWRSLRSEWRGQARMSRMSPLVRGASKRLAQIDQVLEQAYMTPRADLGNQDDPLDEAIYIILSFQTDLPRVSATWSKLRNRYKTWNEVAEAAATDLEHVLRDAGLHR